MSTDVTTSRVLVVGSANVDYAVAAPRLPRVGETVTGGTLLVNHGGKGANQAVAARRLGAEVRFVACVGDDGPGLEIRAALEGEGIGVAGVSVTREAATGTALIVIDPEGRNQITVAPGANRHLLPDHVRARRQDFAWARIVVCQLETPLETTAWALGEARQHGAVTVLNPAPVRDGIPDIWKLVDYLTPNEGESERLTGVAVRDRDSAGAAGQALRRLGVGTAILTLGAEGALACTAGGNLAVAAHRVAVVDTTAAGDTFTGALAAALGAGHVIEAAVRFANAAAALTCTRRGAQASLPMGAEVAQLLAAGSP